MNPSIKARRTMAIAGGVIAPILAIQMLHSVMSMSPAPAPTGYTVAAVTPPVPIPSTASKPLTTEQRKALDWLRARPSAPIAKTPMEFREPPPTAAPIETHIEPAPAAPIDTPPVPAAPPPAMTLSVVLTRPEGALAMINGRVYRVGDAVSAGWTVSQIDGTEFTATVKATDGRSVILKIHR